MQKNKNVTNRNTTPFMAYHALFASYVSFEIMAWGASDETEGSEKNYNTKEKSYQNHQQPSIPGPLQTFSALKTKP